MRARIPPLVCASLALLGACGGSGSADSTGIEVAFDDVGDVPATLLMATPDTTDPTDVTEQEAGTGVGAFVGGNRLLVIGDSIMESTSVAYGGSMCTALVPQRWQVEVVARNGEHVEYGHQVLDERLDAGWDAAVVMLGSNYDGDQVAYEQQLGALVDRLAPRPVLLLTVTEFTESRHDVNDSIEAVAAVRDHAVVLDWALESAENPSVLGSDGLHLSDAGRQVIAELIAERMGTPPDHLTGACLGDEHFEIPETTAGVVPHVGADEFE